MHHDSRVAAVLFLAVWLASCGGGPAAPTTPPVEPPPTHPAPGPTTGHTTDILASVPAPNVSITGAAVNTTTSSIDGSFTITPTQFGGAFIINFSSASYVSRTTALKIPGPDAAVSLIPATFDLVAFNQMVHAFGESRRWTVAPPLRIEKRILQYDANGNGQYRGLDGTLTDDEVASMVKDLTWALPQLTGGQFPTFDSVTTDSAPALSTVTVQNPGVITVARVSGLRSATTYDGLTTRLGGPNFTVTGAAILLEILFDRLPGTPTRDVRAHELGHALGYEHVTSRTSLMNPTQIGDPTVFDLQAALIAYQRPAGNTPPDTDPIGANTVNRQATSGWGRPIH